MASAKQESQSVDPLAPFSVVLMTGDTTEAVVLHAAADADRATIAFYQERQRLLQDQVVGELLLIRRGAQPRTLLREPLSPVVNQMSLAPDSDDPAH